MGRCLSDGRDGGEGRRRDVSSKARGTISMVDRIDLRKTLASCYRGTVNYIMFVCSRHDRDPLNVEGACRK